MMREWIALMSSILGGLIWIAVIFSGKRGKKIEEIIKQEKERVKCSVQIYMTSFIIFNI